MNFHATAQASIFASLLSASAFAGSVYAAADIDFTWYRQRPGSIEQGPAVTARRGGWAAPQGVLLQQLSQRPFHKAILEASRQAGVDPVLVHAVIGVESAYNARAVSHKGALGLMQVIPGTGRRYGVDNLLNPQANIRAGTQYLSHLMVMFNGDLRLALAAYNAGEGAVLRYGGRIPPYQETRAYVPRVLSIYDALSVQARHDLKD